MAELFKSVTFYLTQWQVVYCKKNLITREEKASMAALNTIIVYALNLEKVSIMKQSYLCNILLHWGQIPRDRCNRRHLSEQHRTFEGCRHHKSPFVEMYTRFQLKKAKIIKPDLWQYFHMRKHVFLKLTWTATLYLKFMERKLKFSVLMAEENGIEFYYSKVKKGFDKNSL